MANRRLPAPSPKIRKPIEWAAWAATIAAIGSLLTAVSAERTQTIQNEPYLAVVEAITAPSKDYHPKGTPPFWDTELTFKNNGTSQATHLKFASVGWYSISSSGSSTTSSGGSSPTMNMILSVHADTLQITSPWQTTSADNTLDRDQPTRHLFTSFPRNEEPEGAIDHLYIEVEFDDDFMPPFRRHHLEKFCEIRLPASLGMGDATIAWNRSPLGDCNEQYREIIATQKNGPIVTEQ